jgi:hypothetical protein
VGEWVGGWVEVKAFLRIAYSNQQSLNQCFYLSEEHKVTLQLNIQ